MQMISIQMRKGPREIQARPACQVVQQSYSSLGDVDLVATAHANDWMSLRALKSRIAGLQHQRIKGTYDQAEGSQFVCLPATYRHHVKQKHKPAMFIRGAVLPMADDAAT